MARMSLFMGEMVRMDNRMKKAKKILPCPFCGSEPEVCRFTTDEGGDNRRVQCQKVGCGETMSKLKTIPADECGGGRKIAVMTEVFTTIQIGFTCPKQPPVGWKSSSPLQWVPKNMARDMERTYMQQVADLQRELKACKKALRNYRGTAVGTCQYYDLKKAGVKL